MSTIQIIALCLNVLGMFLVASSVSYVIIHLVGQSLRSYLEKAFKIVVDAAIIKFTLGMSMITAGVTLLNL